MNKNILAAAILGMASMTSALAGEIAISDFTSAQTVINMNGVVAPSSSFSFGGVGFSNTSSGSGGPGWRNLTAFGLGFTDNAGITHINLDLGNSYTKAGLDLYLNATYTVSFFDGADLVASLTKVVAGGPVFAGWENAAGISRIEINESSGDNSLVGGFNNVRLEASAVPEPTSIALFALGLTGFAFARRRKA